MNEKSNRLEMSQAPVELTAEEIDQVSGGVSLLFVPVETTLFVPI